LAQNDEKSNYLKYIDEADHVLDDSPDLATTYLDSIPKPLKNHIDGHLASYYQLRGLISDRKNEQSELYQNFLLALSYAKQEKNYKIAGMTSIELFYNTYVIKKDSSAFHYLEEAKEYFTHINDANGLAEVTQMKAYVESESKNYAKSNELILAHLDEYKNIKDDQYYYLYALFMLTTNHIDLGNISESHKYFTLLKTLQSDPTISKVLYNFHEVSIFTCLATYHFEQKNIDSTLFYLEKSENLRYAMNNNDIRNHFNLYADYYHHIQDVEKKSAYIDSLKIFENKLLNKNLEASLTIHKELENSVNLLESENQKKRAHRNWIIILIASLLTLSITFLVFYKKYQKKIQDFINKTKKASHLKSNHEKLKAKVVGLEQYIIEVKDEVKTIAALQNPQEIRENVKDLYKNLHLKFSTELANSENHLELINELNVRFFDKLKELHPSLHDSEVIICYYLFIGFKNKEIASLLNTSTRAVESKRFRISKKILDQQKDKITLITYLQTLFGESN